jgi:hypothetical protein
MRGDFNMLDAQHAYIWTSELEEPEPLTVDSQHEFVRAVEFLSFNRDVLSLHLGPDPVFQHYQPLCRLKIGAWTRMQQEAQEAPQLAAPMHEHHVCRHYARPTGGAAGSLSRLSLTTSSA